MEIKTHYVKKVESDLRKVLIHFLTPVFFQVAKIHQACDKNLLNRILLGEENGSKSMSR